MSGSNIQIKPVDRRGWWKDPYCYINDNYLHLTDDWCKGIKVPENVDDMAKLYLDESLNKRGTDDNIQEAILTKFYNSNGKLDKQFDAALLKYMTPLQRSEFEFQKKQKGGRLTPTGYIISAENLFDSRHLGTLVKGASERNNVHPIFVLPTELEMFLEGLNIFDFSEKESLIPLGVTIVLSTIILIATKKPSASAASLFLIPAAVGTSSLFIGEKTDRELEYNIGQITTFTSIGLIIAIGSSSATEAQVITQSSLIALPTLYPLLKNWISEDAIENSYYPQNFIDYPSIFKREINS